MTGEADTGGAPAEDHRKTKPLDLAIIGGGINGCGIARDAAGRGLRVALFEMGDLGQATSSASTKLFHGGLRYLEHYEFRLVRESLIERERLIRAMPHIAWPMRFVLPHHKGLRPAWLLRLGLFLYDNLGGREILPGTRTLDLRTDPVGKPLKPALTKGFEYSDGWVQDSQLVVLNARDAANRGAGVHTRTRLDAAERRDNLWHLTVSDTVTGAPRSVQARGLVNAGGPWVDEIIRGRLRQNSAANIRLVRGSHIVVPRLTEHDRAYIFQNADGRIVFAIPYETDFTLIGTTDAEHEGDPSTAQCSDEEARYLCAAVSEYFAEPVTTEQIVWRYAGVRPLYDDGTKSASAATRDYVLEVEDQDGAAPVLNIFGGKITTYRRLAEAALAKLAPWYSGAGAPWTAGVALPGGDFPWNGFEDLCTRLIAEHPFLGKTTAMRLVRGYGTDAWAVLDGARTQDDLGETFGADLTEREVRFLMDRQWARTAEDVLWRRTKLGLRLETAEVARLEAFMATAISRSGDAAQAAE
ncbi:MAG: glycerol-3-phosphate dehydrogenase [Pseudomonadota bacterium]